MIRFTLACADSHEFEGWFKDSAAFDSQAAAGQLSCPFCGNTEVRKGVMAPAIARSRGAGELSPELAKRAAMLQVLRQVHEHVEKNFENVGDGFAEEARRIHHGEADKRDIWGRATPAQAKELHEEGIQVRSLPDLPKLDG